MAKKRVPRLLQNSYDKDRDGKIDADAVEVPQSVLDALEDLESRVEALENAQE